MTEPTTVETSPAEPQPVSDRLAALIAALHARGVDGEAIVMAYLVDVVAPVAGIEYVDATGTWERAKDRCEECDEFFDLDDMHAHDGICGSCDHNARRSG